VSGHKAAGGHQKKNRGTKGRADRDRRETWCALCSKKAFADKRTAKTVRRSTGDGLQTYRCPHGSGWHNGTPPVALKEGRMSRAELAEHYRQQKENQR
jgi:uncharacterized protein YlaI